MQSATIRSLCVRHIWGFSDRRAAALSCSWLKSTYAETGDTEDADKGCAKLMHAIDLYQDRLIEWSMPEFRTKVAEAQTWSFVDAEGGIDGHEDSAVVHDHLAFVQPLRTIVPPKVRRWVVQSVVCPDFSTKWVAWTGARTVSVC